MKKHSAKQRGANPKGMKREEGQKNYSQPTTQKIKSKYKHFVTNL
jgi:hypothetical protein